MSGRAGYSGRFWDRKPMKLIATTFISIWRRGDGAPIANSNYRSGNRSIPDLVRASKFRLESANGAVEIEAQMVVMQVICRLQKPDVEGKAD